MTNDEIIAKTINEMDPELFATALVCEKFWEWTNDPSGTMRKKKLIAKRYQLPEDCELVRLMTAFLAGADAGADIMSKVYEA